MSDFFITEVGGIGRWTQLSVTFPFVRSFFGGEPQIVTQVVLLELDAKGVVSATHPQGAIYKNSRNWAFELPHLHGTPYPGKTHRPIAVFRRRPGGTYPYEVFMPNDVGYPQLESYLSKKRKPGRLTRTQATIADVKPLISGSSLVI